MGPIAQFLTGAFPALFGGAMENTSTAAGYSMARDQAMGRIGLVWRRMKFFHADVMLLAVDCFRRNRPNDVEVTLLGAGAAFESKWIRLADLKGNLFSYPETDEQYPTLWSQQRAVLLQLMSSPDPQIQSVLGHPENFALIKRLIGLEEFVIPDEESRTKQYREIAQLVAESPIVASSDAASTGTLDPRHSEWSDRTGLTRPDGTAGHQTGLPGRRLVEPGRSVEESLFDVPSEATKRDPSAPSRGRTNRGETQVARDSAQGDGGQANAAPGSGPSAAVDVVLPSIMPDEFADNHAVELEICMRWFSSDAGQVAKIESPAGYANVRAHALFHRDYMLKQQRRAAVQSAAPPGGPPRPAS